MDTSRKICTVLTAEDLSEGKISETAAIIEHNLNKVYLMNPSVRLCNVIDQMSKVIRKKSALTKTHIAYNLSFGLKTVLKTGNDLSADGEEVKTCADLFELILDENLSLKREDYHVIIDDENLTDKELANQAVAKLFQQTIFLNIGLDIQKKSEIKMSIMKNRFRANYSELVTQIKKQKDFLNAALQHAGLNDSGKKRVREMFDALKQTEERLAAAKERPLRIAAMGTKKAGKSVVINDLLRRDFAPTSTLLPTPNTVKYIPIASDGQLTLDYAGKKFTFVTAEALKKFIGDEFTKAQEQTGKGAALPDMTIYYPCDDLNGYEIWDTPGPNYAGAGDEHRKNAEACIREVDVCIFVMDYSKYLTDDEANFLKDIRSAFQKNNKFYSLFITVNKIDLIYTSEGQKSVNLVLDYIGGKLEDLDYKNIVIFGTSALQSFYLDKVIEIAKTDGATKPPFVTADSVNKLADNHMDEDDLLMTSIDTIGGMINKLLRFHGIKGATEKEIEAFSGIPQLRRYTKYIGETKADMEIVNKVVGDCEGHFAIIRSALNLVEYYTLSDEAKKYLRTVSSRIDDVVFKSKDIKYRMGTLTTDRGRRNAVRKAKELAEQLRLDTIRDFNVGVDFELERLSVTEENIRDLAKDKTKTGFMVDFSKGIAGAFTRTKNEAVEDCKRIVRVTSGERRDEIKSALDTATKEIIDMVSDINVTLRKSGVPTITLPTFPIDVSMPTPKVSVSGSIDSKIALNIAENSIKVVERTGFFGWIADIFTTKTEVNIDEFKKNIADVVKAEGREQLNKAFADLSRNVQDGIDEIFDRFMDDCDRTSNIYQKIFENTQRNIVEVLDATGKKKEELDRNIAALKSIEENMQPYLGIWNDIRGGE
ncbi:MAG: dynamin family protein [Quinella sp. 1Q5]|nr:dynamin family protein [Quinella sp. 1Q5]